MKKVVYFLLVILSLVLAVTGCQSELEVTEAKIDKVNKEIDTLKEWEILTSMLLNTNN